MSKRKGGARQGALLELWRPPQGAGEPVGCLATTYTFGPGLFDEQCLARFLDIESEPNREDLAFLLERESRLGGVYAGVLVDHTQAGVEHSLRWDVLPVRIWAGRQHAKLSLLVWTRHVRIIVGSANLTEPGYRSNHEVAASIDLSPKESNPDLAAAATSFLRKLLSFVPGAADSPPEVRRAEEFLDDVDGQISGWNPSRLKGSGRQQLTFTLPAIGEEEPARSSLKEAIEACRRRGGLPSEAWVASPFFDAEDVINPTAESLCKLMARGEQRKICFCVPAVRDGNTSSIPRLAAPISLVRTAEKHRATVSVEMLPDVDADKNLRPWHAKMLALRSSKYSALMIGSSNFTCAGIGVKPHRNAEANLLTIVDHVDYGREAGQLEALWPAMEPVDDPETAEWLGTRPDTEDDEQMMTPIPAGFLSATYRAGDRRQIILRIEPDQLPADWQVHACGQSEGEILSKGEWDDRGRLRIEELDWSPILPPDKLLVRWDDHEAFWPLNVEDSRALPPPARLEQMSADDMLLILAATDPSAAIRAWAKREQPTDLFDSDLDTAEPIDLDPLRRHDLQATFLHRIRHRARVLAQFRANLQRPVWGRQALEWRLTGLVGIEALADRLVREFANANGLADEALLTLADFLIVLHQVDYQPSDGSLPKVDFDEMFRPFLVRLGDKLERQVGPHRERVSEELMEFWGRVLGRCRA
ncbi:MAG TPA: hypothetical protein VEB21_09400 [Terriglobales bacterium]|nr:hypothetical protein [Terriglobales bacterium]